MKKRKIRVFIWGILQLSLSAFFFFGAFSVSRDLETQTPNAIELYDTQGLDVSMAQAAPVIQQGGVAAAGLGETVQVTDMAESKSVSAYCQMTTPNYGACANLQFSEGGYFSDDVSSGHAAVIPESLAEELFAERSGEKKLLINGEKFTVCGVYEDGGILARLGLAKLPVIYGNGSESPDAQAEHLLIEADAGKTALQQKQETAVMLETPLGGEMHDFGRLHQLGDSLLLLGFFFAGLWFVLRLCIFSYRKLILAYEDEEHTAKRGFAASFGVGAFLLAVIGFWLLCQLVRIPAVYLPKDNIFDLSYYGQEILSGIQQIHTDCRIHDFSRICAVYLCTEAGLLLLAVPFFWAGCQKLRRGLLHVSFPLFSKACPWMKRNH